MTSDISLRATVAAILYPSIARLYPGREEIGDREQIERRSLERADSLIARAQNDRRAP